MGMGFLARICVVEILFCGDCFVIGWLGKEGGEGRTGVFYVR